MQVFQILMEIQKSPDHYCPTEIMVTLACMAPQIKLGSFHAHIISLLRAFSQLELRKRQILITECSCHEHIGWLLLYNYALIL